MAPRLLVSVRSLPEAEAALQGGADIIDVKDPDQGSLGRASCPVIREVLQAVRSQSPHTLVTAALGEVAEFPQGSAATTADGCPVLSQLNLVKAGLANTLAPPSPAASEPDWMASWDRMRQKLFHVPAASRPDWVAVAYADAQRSRCPEPFQVLAAGRDRGCPVLLVDTYVKDQSCLLDWLSTTQLARLRTETRQAGMQLALAGRVSAECLPQVLSFGPDIVAVRGAVCDGGDRGCTVQQQRVAELKRQCQSVVIHQ